MAVLSMIALLLIAAWPVMAHDHTGAGWIQHEPRYVDAAGVHCCTPGRDCLPAQPGEIRRVPGGWLHVPTGTALRDGRAGVYTSRDPGGKPFRCVRGGEMRCYFPGAGI